jgi:hypothetical protein
MEVKHCPLDSVHEVRETPSLYQSIPGAPVFWQEHFTVDDNIGSTPSHVKADNPVKERLTCVGRRYFVIIYRFTMSITCTPIINSYIKYA